MRAVITLLLFTDGTFVLTRLANLIPLIVSIAAHLIVMFYIGKNYGDAVAKLPSTRFSEAKIVEVSLSYSEQKKKNESDAVDFKSPLTPDSSTLVTTQAQIAEFTNMNSAGQTSDPASESQAQNSASATQSLTTEHQALIPVIGVAAPRYYTPKELTEKPQVLQDIPVNLTLNVSEDTPERAVVRLLINEQGQIDEVLVEDTSLKEAAKKLINDTFQKLIFIPGKIGQNSVKSQMRIEIQLDKLPSRPVFVSPVQQLQ